MNDHRKLQETLNKFYPNATLEEALQIRDTILSNPEMLSIEVMTHEDVKEYYGNNFPIFVVDGNAVIIKKIREYGQRLLDQDQGAAEIILDQIKNILDDIV